MSPSPGTKLAQNRGACLDDLELHVLFVPVAIGSTDNVLSFGIDRLELS